ncbi:AAA family ATPase [Bradyrhizobium sp. 141]|uniref:AAA family ATPase n=1 Tax=Bradyrhizobium sp. 141 TaxID=2782617 RepID=UPI001FF8E6D9|nr:AAA family ATPase [Bradyrhizobium sp. 141]
MIKRRRVRPVAELGSLPHHGVMHPSSALIVFGGLPGTGKTTISRELTVRLAATYLRIDSIEQALKDAGLTVNAEGYAIANALAAENLKLGRIVIADCVNQCWQAALRGGNVPCRPRHAWLRSKWFAAKRCCTGNAWRAVRPTLMASNSQAGMMS